KWENHNTEEHCESSSRHGRHKRSHTEDKPSATTQCVKAFAYHNYLQREIEDHDESDMATGVRHGSYSRRQRSHILNLQHEAESGNRKE
ncbi:Zinc finger protein 431, partial [Lemmus lemmus]